MRIDNVLVTGGCGFIGSHLVEKLVRSGFSVRVLDSLVRGSQDKLASVIGRIDLCRADIMDLDVVVEATKDVDAVFHLAALTDVQESMKEPLLYHNVNATGTLNLLESARKKMLRFIYVSSTAVYGEPTNLPIGEDHLLNPLSAYAASKVSGEGYCNVYAKSYDLKTTVFRLFNVYGPRQNPDYAGVITNFINRVNRGEAPVIFGDGVQTRDFVSVEDVVDVLANSIQAQETGIFNIGSGRSTSINDLAALLLKLMGGRGLTPHYIEAKVGDIKHSCADISRARETFGFEPKVDLKGGLAKVIDSIKYK